ncbi:NHLP leader peptide family RiPP precursor [Ruegeria sp. 2205SS24-7]|uniref:NHLP leader peptide family RiPP precursor n=1 Tax=Ruegeria discodermiae TaxID=3064389 RepID=UPI00274129A6|nr:NHLP leader peptide family RiPP precursor [Ruegeria sp. 2205SS24-7]MDP5216898.1 NHLP leader peptide family RiPP precursor [Ruegeria sp. 2205SS24-7]
MKDETETGGWCWKSGHLIERVRIERSGESSEPCYAAMRSKWEEDMKPMNKNSAEAQKAAFFEKIWNDDAFARALEANPRAALAEFGNNLPENVDIRVVRDTEKVKYLHIPAVPVDMELSDADLISAQGGTTPLCGVILGSIISVASVSVSATFTKDM